MAPRTLDRDHETATFGSARNAGAGPARVLCDWGRRRLRVFLEIDGSITAWREGPGIGELGQDSPTEALARVLEPWRARCRLEHIVLCGMAGSRTGLAEVPYLRAPATIAQWCARASVLRRGESRLIVLPGVQAQSFRDVADVMRGGEARIFGALSLEPTLGAGRHMMVLPDTHSKWVEVRDGRIARLQTYVTGELFELLGTRSSLLPRTDGPSTVDEEAFEIGLRNAERFDVGANLFETLSAQLIEGRPAGWARSLLLGVLVGAEVHSMLALANAASESLTLIGEPALTARYARALGRYGADARRLEGDRCVVAGLRAAAHGVRVL